MSRNILMPRTVLFRIFSDLRDTHLYKFILYGNAQLHQKKIIHFPANVLVMPELLMEPTNSLKSINVLISS
ncbi:unnamed protein product [Allacma fusca]|uniref:Uncharacterized protein n=1 Tax=Allacma fusca TaxID=39272 RepID=A0A8J2PI90_9HEXA|nr:unnamed protein product [Allacma fusca]